MIRKEFRGELNANVCGTDIEVFTWGDGFCSGALAIAYGSAVWHDLKTLGIHNRKKMVVIQTRCLLSIAGAFKATLIEILYVETIMPPLQEDLDHLQVKAQSRFRVGGQRAFMKEHCKRVATRNSMVNAEQTLSGALLDVVLGPMDISLITKRIADTTTPFKVGDLLGGGGERGTYTQSR